MSNNIAYLCNVWTVFVSLFIDIFWCLPSPVLSPAESTVSTVDISVVTRPLLLPHLKIFMYPSRKFLFVTAYRILLIELLVCAKNPATTYTSSGHTCGGSQSTIRAYGVHIMKNNTKIVNVDRSKLKSVLLMPSFLGATTFSPDWDFSKAFRFSRTKRKIRKYA